VRWVALFTVLLLASSAVPVLAEDPPPPPAPTEAELATLPDAQDIQEGVAAAEQREEEREEELESPKAAREREESRDAFAELSVGESQELLSAIFPSELATLNSDPAVSSATRRSSTPSRRPSPRSKTKGTRRSLTPTSRWKSKKRTGIWPKSTSASKPPPRAMSPSTR
jgi:hypothetical protein